MAHRPEGQLSVTSLILAGTITGKAAPPFAIFEGWVPRPKHPALSLSKAPTPFAATPSAVGRAETGEGTASRACPERSRRVPSAPQKRFKLQPPREPSPASAAPPHLSS
jgi:hypothetical protein